jgi:hypothetical protein
MAVGNDHRGARRDNFTTSGSGTANGPPSGTRHVTSAPRRQDTPVGRDKPTAIVRVTRPFAEATRPVT